MCKGTWPESLAVWEAPWHSEVANDGAIEERGKNATEATQSSRDRRLPGFLMLCLLLITVFSGVQMCFCLTYSGRWNH